MSHAAGSPAAATAGRLRCRPQRRRPLDRLPERRDRSRAGPGGRQRQLDVFLYDQVSGITVPGQPRQLLAGDRRQHQPWPTTSAATSPSDQRRRPLGRLRQPGDRPGARRGQSEPGHRHLPLRPALRRGLLVSSAAGSPNAASFAAGARDQRGRQPDHLPEHRRRSRPRAGRGHGPQPVRPGAGHRRAHPRPAGWETFPNGVDTNVSFDPPALRRRPPDRLHQRLPAGRRGLQPQLGRLLFDDAAVVPPPDGPVRCPPARCSPAPCARTSASSSTSPAPAACPPGVKQVAVKLTVSQGTGKGNVQLYPGNVRTPASRHPPLPARADQAPPASTSRYRPTAPAPSPCSPSCAATAPSK